ncbi:MAG: hypothetical protein J1E81_03930 [Eubacterium sp.]|nr:hypothetical protein [Eubacterium sp.]
MKFAKLIKYLLFPDIWCSAVRFNKDDNTSILNDTVNQFTVVKDTYRYWTADPFLVKENGKYYLFFEAYDRLKRKGLLGYREITDNSFGDIKIIYESNKHLSYPFIYKNDDTYYIVPESNKQGELFRLKCTGFPDKWEKETLLLKDNLVDTTIYTDSDGVNYYISERVDERNIFDRVDLFYEENGELKECESNPVKVDASNARGAGKLFEFEDKLIRPSQDCDKAYGEKLNFNQVLSISKNGFKEKPYRTICVNEIKLDKNYNFVGIHTYNRLDNVEVIDLKIPNKFNFLSSIGAVIKLVKRFF